MLNIKNFILSLFLFSMVLSTWLSNARPGKNNLLTRLNFDFLQTLPQDTLPDSTQNDSTKKAEQSSYEPSRRSTYDPEDRHGDPFSNRVSPSPLLLDNPSSIQMEVEIDTGMDYTIYEKIGDVNYRPPTQMTFEEFTEYQNKRMLREYWKTRAKGLDGESAVSNRGLIPPIYISPIFDKIFGGSYVDLQPTGFVTLDFGGRWQRVDNPSYPIRQQRNGGFEFDQQINMNVIGQIGDKLKVTANFDNNSSFDFENDFRVEYTGYEEDIIQKIEIGNVSMPVNNSLIGGSQNLFGIKTQLRFGRLFVTGLASTQRGSTDMMEIEGGGQVREFEIRASEYDENRHFFLGHFFKNNYGTDPNQWLNRLPVISSNLNINRIEVYVINRNNDTETQRNFVGFTEMGELIADGNVVESNSTRPASNELNTELAGILNNLPRDIDRINGSLTEVNFVNGQDYEKVNNARKLSEGEYIVNRQLGYISLTRKLQNDEALAVAFEYTYNGQTYQVGEMTEDAQNISANQAIFLKLLRPARVDVGSSTWDLMMKNIYNLNANQITPEGFDLRVVYRDDKSGMDNPIFQEGPETVKDKQIVQVVGADRLNQNGDPPSDGVFDFVEGITIQPENGLIIFPNREPFGEEITEAFANSSDQLRQKYVYDTLYNTTKAESEQVAGSNKYFIRGSFLSGSANEIMLPGINIAEGSVVVMAGNTPLTEGVDYEVDYNLGRVTILSQNLQNENIKISYEKADLFSFQTRSLLGTRLDYRVNDDINIGATLLYLNERPPNTNYRATIGQESMRNTKWGIDVNYQKDSRFLTKMIDALPLIETKEISTVTFNGEFAQLIPGTSNKINGEGTSYIDDFEASVTPFNLGGSSFNWKLAAPPNYTEYVPNADGIQANFRRAKLAWYVIDNAFYRNNGRGTPDHLTDEDLKNHYVRQVLPQEVFPQRSRDQINNNLPIFDLAYYPEERGQYNYNGTDSELEEDGKFTKSAAAANWGGITRAITSDVDFDKTNIEYIEFWMLDPYINSEYGVVEGIRGNDRSDGKLIFNLGTISEDVLPDESQSFENGLPSAYPGSPGSDFRQTDLGRLPLDAAPVTNGFGSGNRENQDVGLDGWKSSNEFTEYFNAGNPAPTLSAVARAQLENDASSDDFRYFLHPEYDAQQASILERYKRYNNMEGNTPVVGSANLDYTPIGNSEPDNEDVNNDNTITSRSQEQYYEYVVDIEKGGLAVGNNYIVDKVTTSNNFTNEEVNWYLFRIPIREAGEAKNGINNFKTIRFLRTYLTDFNTPVVLRMAKFQLVGSQWRRFDKTLQEAPNNNQKAENPVTVSVVNIEENGDFIATGSSEGGTIPYVLPPGVEREQDNTTQYTRQANEQSLQICVEDLPEGQSNAVFKNVSVDMINYGRLKMFFHAQQNGATLANGDVSAFIRLGTDFEDNYYEIEVPLVITPENVGNDRRAIWPLENEIDIPLDALYALKSARNRERRESQDYQTPFNGTHTNENGVPYNLKIKGRPELSTVQVVMIGVRNPEDGTVAGDQSVCVWANELRVSDFDRSSGWAANARLNTKLADFANITTSARYTSFGFGGIQQKISERTREEIKEFDIAANVALDKLLPEKAGLQIPMYLSYRSTLITPEFDPLDPDIPLKASLASIENSEERNNYEEMVQDNTVRRGINFTNVRKVKTNPEAKDHLYDIENFAFSYAYSDILQHDIRTEQYKFVSQRASIAYNYAPKELIIAPFKNVKIFSSPYLALIKDFNFSPVPNNLSFRADVVRTYAKTQLRNADLTTVGIDPTFEKSFSFNRFYDVRWNLTQGLSLDYNARANAIIDEPDGELDTDYKRDEVLDNLKNFGRMKNFDQSVALNYRLPLDKLPFTDWISADLRYQAGYNWAAGSYNPYLPDSVISLKELYGNTIQNTRERTLTGNMDLTKLYNKVKVLKAINEPPRRRGRNEQADTVRSVTDNKFLTGFLKVLMSVKSINATYSIREGTLLPGFEKDVFLFGMDTSFSAPGIPFLLGSQNPAIREEAARNGWLIDSAGFINSFSQTQSVDLNIRANVEPVKDLRIQLDVRKLNTAGYRENFSISENDDYNPLSPSRFGSYSISFIGIKTAFTSSNSDNESPIFQDFDNYRNIIKGRVSAESDAGLEYSENNQDVLIPAFVAAYSGKDPNDVDLTPFPKIPLPNWRVDYAGLSKIPALSSIFSSVNLTHSYNATYSVNNYTSSAQIQDADILNLENNIVDYPLSRNNDGNLTPVYAVSQVVISERFSPLIGINVRTRSRLNARVEYRKERNISLNVANAQVAELNSNDILIDFGFTKANIRLPFRTKGRTTVLKNDLTFRVGLTIRDTETIQRRLSAPQGGDSTSANNVITSGNINYQLRPTLDYVLNQRLNLQLYFERTINEPKISSSFRRSTTAFGTKLTFNLAQ